MCVKAANLSFQPTCLGYHQLCPRRACVGPCSGEPVSQAELPDGNNQIPLEGLLTSRHFCPQPMRGDHPLKLFPSRRAWAERRSTLHSTTMCSPAHHDNQAQWDISKDGSNKRRRVTAEPVISWHRRPFRLLKTTPARSEPSLNFFLETQHANPKQQLESLDSNTKHQRAQDGARARRTQEASPCFAKRTLPRLW